MQDSAVVAAVVAGDADGFGAAYDEYAASLYAYCRSVLPEPEAAEAVLDTFLIARAKLDGLGDPGQLGAWLHAVARNECRRLGPNAPEGPAGDAVSPPDELRGQVLAACTDDTPAGRARRVSVAHRAGAFDLAGFPRAAGPSGPRWWHRHPELASAAGLVVPLVVAVAVAVILVAGGGSHHPAATAARSTAIPATSASGAPGQTPSVMPAHRATASATVVATATATAQATPSASLPAGASSPVSPPTSPAPSPPAPTSGSPSPSPSPSSPSGLGYLLVMPSSLSLSSRAGQAVSGSFELSAVNGPVPRFSVQVSAKGGTVTVSPSAGSVPAGGMVTVTVTVTSKAALTAQITVQPNSGSVSVSYTPSKPKPRPSPSSSPTASKGKGGRD